MGRRKTQIRQKEKTSFQEVTKYIRRTLKMKTVSQVKHTQLYHYSPQEFNLLLSHLRDQEDGGNSQELCCFQSESMAGTLKKVGFKKHFVKQKYFEGFSKTFHNSHCNYNQLVKKIQEKYKVEQQMSKLSALNSTTYKSQGPSQSSHDHLLEQKVRRHLKRYKAPIERTKYQANRCGHFIQKLKDMRKLMGEDNFSRIYSESFKFLKTNDYKKKLQSNKQHNQTHTYFRMNDKIRPIEKLYRTSFDESVTIKQGLQQMSRLEDDFNRLDQKANSRKRAKEVTAYKQQVIESELERIRKRFIKKKLKPLSIQNSLSN